jgi:hypothetical protein
MKYENLSKAKDIESKLNYSKYNVNAADRYIKLLDEKTHAVVFFGDHKHYNSAEDKRILIYERGLIMQILNLIKDVETINVKSFQNEIESLE